jgi:hypothetical protein
MEYLSIIHFKLAFKLIVKLVALLCFPILAIILIFAAFLVVVAADAVFRNWPIGY